MITQKNISQYKEHLESVIYCTITSFLDGGIPDTPHLWLSLQTNIDTWLQLEETHEEDTMIIDMPVNSRMIISKIGTDQEFKTVHKWTQHKIRELQ